MATGSQLFNSYTSQNGTKAETTAKITALQTSNIDQWNSIIFDTKRHSIWAQGQEYGFGGGIGQEFATLTYGSGTPYTTNTAANITNNGAGVARQFVSKITYFITNDKFTISYESAFESSLSLGTASGDFVDGMTVSGHQITNSYGTFTNAEHAKTAVQSHVITYTYIDNTGKIHADYRDLTVNSTTHPGTKANNGNSTGTIVNSTKIDNDSNVRVITNITQSSDGQISYTYQDICGDYTLSGSTSTSNLPVLINMTQNSDGDITYYYRDISLAAGNGGTQADATYIDNDTTFNVISSITQDKSGHISYTYTPVRTEIKFQTTSSSPSSVTITNTVKANVVTGFSQNNDGKITYTYTVLNTTHSSSGSAAYANQVINNISLSADGVLSYTTRNLEGGLTATYFTYAYSQTKDGFVTMQQGNFTKTDADTNSDYVKDITFTNHTIAVTRGKLSGGSDGGPETAISTASYTNLTYNRKFISDIGVSELKNHRINITYYKYPAVVCTNSTVKYVVASGSTLTFYSTEPAS